MISPGWAAFILSVVIAGCGVVGAWAVARHEIAESKEQMKAFTGAILRLETTIGGVGKELKGLLFNAADAGRPFYQRADDCRSHRMECAEEIDERLISLEARAHTHEAPRM